MKLKIGAKARAALEWAVCARRSRIGSRIRSTVIFLTCDCKSIIPGKGWTQKKKNRKKKIIAAIPARTNCYSVVAIVWGYCIDYFILSANSPIFTLSSTNMQCVYTNSYPGSSRLRDRFHNSNFPKFPRSRSKQRYKKPYFSESLWLLLLYGLWLCVRMDVFM